MFISCYILYVYTIVKRIENTVNDLLTIAISGKKYICFITLFNMTIYFIIVAWPHCLTFVFLATLFDVSVLYELPRVS